MARVRIISLGEVVQQNQMAAVVTLSQLIDPTSKDDPSSEKARVAMAAAQKILQDERFQTHLMAFKTGKLPEKAFDDVLIDMVTKVTGVVLTPNQINEIWNTMNPSHGDFSRLLTEVTDEHRPPGVIIEFISATNVKDMRCLRTQLEAACIPYDSDDKGNISAIRGVALSCTHVTGQTKAKLIETRIGHHQPKSAAPTAGGSGAGSSASAADIGFFSTSAAPSEVDIRYVLGGTKEHKMPALAELARKSNEGVLSTVATFGVATVFWDKKTIPFNEAIFSDDISVVPISCL